MRCHLMSMHACTICLNWGSIRMTYCHQLMTVLLSTLSVQISSQQYGLTVCCPIQLFPLQLVMGGSFATPDSLLDCINCKCKTGCQTQRCSCKKANLNYTELCSCCNCHNTATEIADDEDIPNNMQGK